MPSSPIASRLARHVAALACCGALFGCGGAETAGAISAGSGSNALNAHIATTGTGACAAANAYAAANPAMAPATISGHVNVNGYDAVSAIPTFSLGSAVAGTTEYALSVYPLDDNCMPNLEAPIASLQYIGPGTASTTSGAFSLSYQSPVNQPVAVRALRLTYATPLYGIYGIGSLQQDNVQLMAYLPGVPNGSTTLELNPITSMISANALGKMNAAPGTTLGSALASAKSDVAAFLGARIPYAVSADPYSIHPDFAGSGDALATAKVLGIFETLMLSSTGSNNGAFGPLWGVSAGNYYFSLAADMADAPGSGTVMGSPINAYAAHSYILFGSQSAQASLTTTLVPPELLNGLLAAASSTYIASHP